MCLSRDQPAGNCHLSANSQVKRLPGEFAAAFVPAFIQSVGIATNGLCQPSDYDKLVGFGKSSGIVMIRL